MRKIRVLNFWWTIAIMSLAIISLVSYILTSRIDNADKIMEFISYSTAILSITLSIFAIQYTYISNNQVQYQFEKINTAADNIKNISEKLGYVSGKLEDNMEDILSMLENISQMQKEMSEQIVNRTPSGTAQIRNN